MEIRLTGQQFEVELKCSFDENEDDVYMTLHDLNAVNVIVEDDWNGDMAIEYTLSQEHIEKWHPKIIEYLKGLEND